MPQQELQVATAMLAASLLVTGFLRGGYVSSVRSLTVQYQNYNYCNGRSISHFQRLYVSSSSVYDLELSVTGSSHNNAARMKAREAFSMFARQGRAWRRLSHLVDLSIIGSNNESISANDFNNKTIVDLGTDHGLLAMGLTLSGKFRKVIGVDASDQALKSGALSLLEQVQTRCFQKEDGRFTFDTPVEFRHGDGLKALKGGEADIVCIAGIGVNTILQILNQSTTGGALELDRIRCMELILQPTNSKPRNLMLLYTTLQERGWRVDGERIEKISSRWYVTTHFTRQVILQRTGNIDGVYQGSELHVPGSILYSTLSDSDPKRQILDEYYHHHRKWIYQDAHYGKQQRLDSLWLDRMVNIAHPTEVKEKI
jgi:tRNA A22 N-methylase